MGIIFNEDPNHFIYTRAKAGIKSVDRKMLTDFIDQYKNTNVTDFMVCLNASMTFYPSKRTESALDRYYEWEKAGKLVGKEDDYVISCVKLLCDIYGSGINLHELWLDRLREDGIKAWISIRMNDIHNAGDKDAFLPGNLSKEHPEFMRAGYRAPASYYEYSLDYSHREVREYYLTVISEALDTFDCDGIELDFMREIYCFAVGREAEGCAVMTEFMEEVFALVKKAEQMRGHRILVGVRMPDSPEKAMRLGFDIFSWVNRGWIDLITVTPRWSSSDGDMPMDFWKSALAGKNVRLAAGLEVLLDAYNRRGRKYEFNTFETSVGLSCAYSSMCAETYLFNYMDAVPGFDERELFKPDVYRRLLTTLGDYEKETASPRRHVVSYDDVYASGIPSRRPLPISISESEPVSFSPLRIPTGKIPSGREVQLIIGIERGLGTQGENIVVYANCKKCRFIGAAEGKYPAYTDMDYFAYEIENDGSLPTVTVAEFGITSGNARIHWAEISVLSFGKDAEGL